jgi:hypothetical protein
MTNEQKREIMSKVQVALAGALASMGGFENQVNVTLHDTDISPLQPALGDHLTVSVCAVIRLDDYVGMNPSSQHDEQIVQNMRDTQVEKEIPVMGVPKV